MREKTERRIEELREEFAFGQQKLAALESEANDVRSTLLRISGAIQVLEELLRPDAESASEGAHDPSDAALASTRLAAAS
jgi:predicted  nucleic acid-binding Zn-ribbon protein